MKRVLVLVLILLCISSEVAGEKRRRRRLIAKKKIPPETYSISIGYNTIPGLFSKTLNFDYSLFTKVRIGASLHYIDRENFLEGQVRSPLSCDYNPDNYWINSCVKYQKRNPVFFRFFLKYFPFANGFQLVSYLGRLPDLSLKNIFLPSLEDNSYRVNRLSVRQPGITYTIETKNNYYLALAAGWKWRFTRLFFVAFDAGIMQEINPKRNIYFYGDLRGLAANATVSPVDIAYLNYFTYLPFKERNRLKTHLNFSAGLSF
ncbi:MAG: hypothetical protein AAF518_25635 [Spirochaetota bacterium]